MNSSSVGRIGSQRPRWQHLPEEVVSNAGLEAIDLAAAAGVELDDWQRWVLINALGERADRTWSAFEVGLVMPRQNGKNAVLEARELAGIVLFDDDLIVHTAHRADTTMEHFRRMERYAEEFDEFARLVKHVSRKNGAEEIELKGGRRIKFVSRARNPGRGFSGSVIVLDEAFNLSPDAVGAMIPALATRSMAQVWYTSSAPHRTSQVLHEVRRRGHADEADPRLFYAEWGNEVGADPEDWDNLFAANPGLGIRISTDFVAAERRLMNGVPGEFARERLGIAEDVVEGEQIVDPALWDSKVDAASVVASHRQVALDVSPDRKWAAFGGAGRRADGRLHVETVERKPRTDWVKATAVRMWSQTRIPIRIQVGSPAGAFIDPLRDAGVEVVEVSVAEHAAAVGQFLDAVHGDDLRHLGQASLDGALAGAVMRPSGDVDVWGRRSSSGDITPLVAVTLAVGGVPKVLVGPAGFVDLNDVDVEDD